MHKDVILKLNQLNKKNFKDKKEYTEFLNFQVQEHLVEIDGLRENLDPHLVNECADLAILSVMIALEEGADEDTFKKRYAWFEEKIKEGKKMHKPCRFLEEAGEDEPELELVKL